MTKNLPRWPMLHQVEGRARRTQQMIERLRVDPLKLVRLDRGGVYAEVHEKCLQCRAADTCLLWLQLDEDETEHPDFCPNLEVFLDCIESSGLDEDEKS